MKYIAICIILIIFIVPWVASCNSQKPDNKVFEYAERSVVHEESADSSFELCSRFAELYLKTKNPEHYALYKKYRDSVRVNIDRARNYRDSASMEYALLR